MKRVQKRKIKMEVLKQLIWNLIPYDLEIAIRAAIQPSYKSWHAAREKSTEQKIAKIESKSGKNEKIIVVFFCSFPSIWNSSMSAFQAAREDPDLEVHLLALPQKRMGKDCEISQEVYKKNDSYLYCKEFFSNTITAFCEAEQSWFDLKKLRPDYVILSRPYDEEIQPEYRSEVLASYTKICYIPYSYCKMKWDSRVVYSCDFMDHVYAVFTENLMYCRMLQKIFFDILNGKWKKIQYVGYPRFDLHDNLKKETSSYKKTVLWLPRWTTKGILEPSSFFRYGAALIEYFKANPQFQLICRPHPRMFENFVSTGEMKKTEVERFRKLFLETSNFSLDESGDYLLAFSNADIFISDTSSLLIEEFITGKPIIFCGSKTHFDREAKKWTKLLYSVRGKDELIERLSRLLDGEDPFQVARKQLIQEKFRCDGQCGKRIIEFIKNDYFKEA